MPTSEFEIVRAETEARIPRGPRYALPHYFDGHTGRRMYAEANVCAACRDSDTVRRWGGLGSVVDEAERNCSVCAEALRPVIYRHELLVLRVMHGVLRGVRYSRAEAEAVVVALEEWRGVLEGDTGQLGETWETVLREAKPDEHGAYPAPGSTSKIMDAAGYPGRR